MAEARDGDGAGPSTPEWGYTLTDLTAATTAELDELFADGDCPSLDELDGRYDGAVLSSPHVPVENEEAERFLNAYLSPWEGKRFDATSDPPRGNNVYKVGPVEFDGFGFDSAILPSEVDGEDAYVFDYDISENPAPMRNVKDEIRRIADGLYLGRFYFYVGDDYRFVTYFALQRA